MKRSFEESQLEDSSPPSNPLFAKLLSNLSEKPVVYIRSALVTLNRYILSANPILSYRNTGERSKNTSHPNPTSLSSYADVLLQIPAANELRKRITSWEEDMKINQESFLRTVRCLSPESELQSRPNSSYESSRIPLRCLTSRMCTDSAEKFVSVSVVIQKVGDGNDGKGVLRYQCQSQGCKSNTTRKGNKYECDDGHRCNGYIALYRLQIQVADETGTQTLILRRPAEQLLGKSAPELCTWHDRLVADPEDELAQSEWSTVMNGPLGKRYVFLLAVKMISMNNRPPQLNIDVVSIAPIDPEKEREVLQRQIENYTKEVHALKGMYEKVVTQE